MKKIYLLFIMKFTCFVLALTIISYPTIPILNLPGQIATRQRFLIWGVCLCQGPLGVHECGQEKKCISFSLIQYCLLDVVF